MCYYYLYYTMSDWIKVKKKPLEVRARGPIDTEESHKIDTGTLKADVGDFVIYDGDNTYPIKPDIFHDTYKVNFDPEARDGWFEVKKKPVVVQARKVESELKVETLEGVTEAYEGDYVIKGVDGEKYPIRSSKFFEKYEIIDK